MSVEIFAIKSGTTTYKYISTVGVPTTGLKFDARQPVNISAIENKYSGTVSYSGEITKQLFG